MQATDRFDLFLKLDQQPVNLINDVIKLIKSWNTFYHAERAEHFLKLTLASVKFIVYTFLFTRLDWSRLGRWDSYRNISHVYFCSLSIRSNLQEFCKLVTLTGM